MLFRIEIRCKKNGHLLISVGDARFIKYSKYPSKKFLGQGNRNIFFNPHPLLQKNLLVCMRRGPRGPQKLSSVVKKMCKWRDHFSIFRSVVPMINELAPDKVFRGPHGPRISGWGLRILDIDGANNLSLISHKLLSRSFPYRISVHDINNSQGYDNHYNWFIEPQC